MFPMSLEMANIETSATSPHCVGCGNTSASLVVDNPPPTYSLGREGKVADHRQCSADMVCLTQEERPHLKETVTEGVSMCENDVDHSQSSRIRCNLDHELPFPKPTFSLGLTQEERQICEQDDQLGACRKSKRLKALPKSLVGQYECDMRLLNRARVAFVDPDNIGGNIDYAAKFSSLLDKLKTPFTIHIGQSTLESNDLKELVQRSSPLPPKFTVYAKLTPKPVQPPCVHGHSVCFPALKTVYQVF
ncbi:hypothetical protein Bca52824_076732 [Brassica carinata]|uniref:Uncharacterized protein n=1 Tax=Brassica carinata TaxID=52824 RepID=A0A8X7PUT8_BRACI|nr:hypothetical protein Bca52824_076732 [Brassica carinata]